MTYPDPTDAAEIRTVDDWLAGPHSRIPIRRYEPGLSPWLGIVWLHGGAFVAGDLDMPESDWVARQLAASGIRVVTVDYRLAPNPEALAGPQNPDVARFPVAAEEVAFVFEQVSGESEALPPERWVIGGASAGSTLAASTALRRRDSGLGQAAVVLVYPVQHHDLPPMSAELQAKCDELPDEARFSPESVRMMALNYVGDEARLADPYAFPGGHDLSGLAPSLIINSDHDSLRASGQKFGVELADAGVDVTVVREPTTWHGYLNDPENPAAARTIRRIVDWLAFTMAE